MPKGLISRRLHNKN